MSGHADRPSLETALDSAIGLAERIRVAAEALAADPYASSQDLLSLVNERDAALRNLGLALVDALDDGYELILEKPSTDEPVPDALSEDEPAEEPPATEPPPPEAAPAPPPRPSSPPASASALAALQESLSAPSWEDDAPPPDVQELALLWGRPEDLLRPRDRDAALDQLAEARASIDQWRRLPRSLQHDLLDYATQRARHVQAVHGPLDYRDEGVFRSLAAYSKQEMPGFVHGLAQHHQPQNGSWLDDALAAFQHLGFDESKRGPQLTTGLGELISAVNDRLPDDVVRQFLVPLIEHPAIDQDHLVQVTAQRPALLDEQNEAELRLLKRVRRYLAEREACDNDPSDRPGMDDDWAWRQHTVGKHAVMIGGDDRAQARERIQAAFGFATVEWETGWETRRVEALAKRIERGSVDLLLGVQRFLKHKTVEQVIPSCKRSGVPFAFIDGGYGINQVQAAIERYLDPAE